MDEKRRANCFRDLIVYQKARDVARRVYDQSLSFPKEETYSLTDQVRRSSRSMIQKAGSFCNANPNQIRENVAEYIIESK